MLHLPSLVMHHTVWMTWCHRSFSFHTQRGAVKASLKDKGGIIREGVRV